MKEAIFETLHAQSVLLLFLLIALGYLIGSPKVRGISFGPAAGVLFAGLAFGHLGSSLSTDMKALGFAFLIYSVGYQAGPRFVDVLKDDGLRYFALALTVAGCGFATASIASSLLQLEPGTAASAIGARRRMCHLRSRDGRVRVWFEGTQAQSSASPRRHYRLNDQLGLF